MMKVSIAKLKLNISSYDFPKRKYGGSRAEFLADGYVELQDSYVIFAVSKITDRPATTAGLGDSLIAGSILGVK